MTDQPDQRLDPRSRPPLHVASLVHLLAGHGVEWVLSGSAVLVLYGADLRPNDLDVVPALDTDNLNRLADALHDIHAVPAFFPDWPAGLTLDACREWAPDQPATPDRLDHLFVTTLGMLDVPPTLTGTYTALRPAAHEVSIAGIIVTVCAPDEVLRRLPARPRAKDLERAEQYEIVRRYIHSGAPPRTAPLLNI